MTVDGGYTWTPKTKEQEEQERLAREEARDRLRAERLIHNQNLLVAQSDLFMNRTKTRKYTFKHTVLPIFLISSVIFTIGLNTFASFLYYTEAPNLDVRKASSITGPMPAIYTGEHWQVFPDTVGWGLALTACLLSAIVLVWLFNTIMDIPGLGTFMTIVLITGVSAILTPICTSIYQYELHNEQWVQNTYGYASIDGPIENEDDLIVTTKSGEEKEVHVEINEWGTFLYDNPKDLMTQLQLAQENNQ